MVVVSMASPDMEEETTSEFGYQSLFVTGMQPCAGCQRMEGYLDQIMLIP